MLLTALFQSLIDATTAARTEETTAMEKSLQEWPRNPNLQSERNLTALRKKWMKPCKSLALVTVEV